MQFFLGVFIGVLLCSIAYFLQRRHSSNSYMIYNCPQNGCVERYECDDVYVLLEMMEQHEASHAQHNY